MGKSIVVDIVRAGELVDEISTCGIERAMCFRNAEHKSLFSNHQHKICLFSLFVLSILSSLEKGLCRSSEFNSVFSLLKSGLRRVN